MPELKPRDTKEQGHSFWEGSDWFADIFEETDELAWPNSMQVYQRMRRQSAQIAAVNRAWQMPVMATPWYVRQGPARREVAVQLARDLGLPILEESGEVRATETRPMRRRGRFSWTEHVRLALLSKLFGHMLFNQVYAPAPRSQGGDGLAHLKKLSPRLPHTIAHWELDSDGGLKWVDQHRPWGVDGPVGGIDPVRIRVDELVVYVNDKEGANWHGVSNLRPAYMPFMCKDRLYRLSLVSFERAMGTAVYEASEGASQTEIDRGLEMAKAMRTGEESAHAVPHGASLYYGGIRGTLADPLNMIEHLSVLEGRLMMAQFLNLGSTETGARALGEAFIDFFMLTLQGILSDIADTAQLHVVEDWVDVNYGAAEATPEVVPGEVAGRPQIVAEAVTNLMGNGAITYDEELEAFVRKALGLPPLSQRGRQAQPPGGTPTPPGGTEPTQLASKPFEDRSYRAATNVELEARTDFARLDDTWLRALRRALDQWRGVQGRQIQALLAEVTRAVNQGQVAELGALQANVAEAEQVLARELNDMLGEAVDEAVREARRQGVRIRRPEVASIRRAVKEQAKALARTMGQGLSEKVAREATRNATPALTGEEVAARVSQSLDDLTDSYLVDQLGGALTMAQNVGRSRVFELSGPGRYYSSELLDGRTCSNCNLVDGTEYGTLEQAMAAYPSGGYHLCSGGSRCRGTIVKVHTEAQPSEEAA